MCLVWSPSVATLLSSKISCFSPHKGKEHLIALYTGRSYPFSVCYFTIHKKDIFGCPIKSVHQICTKPTQKNGVFLESYQAQDHTVM